MMATDGSSLIRLRVPRAEQQHITNTAEARLVLTSIKRSWHFLVHREGFGQVWVWSQPEDM